MDKVASNGTVTEAIADEARRQPAVQRNSNVRRRRMSRRQHGSVAECASLEIPAEKDAHKLDQQVVRAAQLPHSRPGDPGKDRGEGTKRGPRFGVGDGHTEVDGSRWRTDGAAEKDESRHVK